MPHKIDKIEGAIVSASDGKRTTFSNSYNRVRQVTDGRQETADAPRPHMLLLRMRQFPIALSDLLGGQQSAREGEAPKPLALNGIEYFASYMGTEKTAELLCHKISVHELAESEKQPSAEFQLWLADERNYIPIRYAAWTYRHPRIPTTEC